MSHSCLIYFFPQHTRTPRAHSVSPFSLLPSAASTQEDILRTVVCARQLPARTASPSTSGAPARVHVLLVQPARKAHRSPGLKVRILCSSRSSFPSVLHFRACAHPAAFSTRLPRGSFFLPAQVDSKMSPSCQHPNSPPVLSLSSPHCRTFLPAKTIRLPQAPNASSALSTPTTSPKRQDGFPDCADAHIACGPLCGAPRCGVHGSPPRVPAADPCPAG